MSEYIIKNKSNPFLVACVESDFAELERRLKAGESVHQHGEVWVRDEQGREYSKFVSEDSAVAVAMILCDFPLLKFLMERGANPYIEKENPDSSSWNAIRSGIMSGFIEGIRYVVDEKGFKLWPYEEGNPSILLHTCILHSSSMPMFRYLVEEKRLSPKNMGGGGRDVLFYSDKAYHLALIRHNPQACSFQDELLRYLVDNGTSPDSQTHHQGIRGVKVPGLSSPGIGVEELSDLNFLNIYNTTGLIRNALYGHVDRVALYLSLGADPLYCDERGHTAFDACSEERYSWHDPMVHSQIKARLSAAVEQRRSREWKPPPSP